VLEPHAGLVASSEVVIRIGWRDALGPDGLTPARVRFRFWSIEPNDLEGVWFGVSRIEWRPNVSEAEYEAHLAARAEEERRRQEAERLRLEAEWQRQQEAQRLEAERERQRLAQRTPEELERDRQRAKAQAEALERDRQRARARAEEEQRRRRAAEVEAEAERRRLAVEAALELERRQRREAYCAGHGEDRDCWGAGGLKVHLELQQHAETRARYCAEHPEDARCWDARERGRRVSAWSGRRAEALRPPREPDGPPPAALAETPPPRLSPNAEWRPGYWHWTGFAWTWLAGMWRVPDSDLVAGLTTTAPQAPPPLRVEVAPPVPAAGAVWIAGFWQWSGKEWVWVAGSWQLRPAPGASWRGATWEVRGRVHVLVPGGWVEVRR
jgi:hypothetical protein